MVSSWICWLGLLLAACLVDAGTFNIAGLDSKNAIEGSFIAVFNKSATEDEVQKCRDDMVAKMRKRDLENGGNGTDAENHQYISVEGFRAMACQTDAATVAEMQEMANDTIAWVEAVQSVSVPDMEMVQQQQASSQSFDRLAIVSDSENSIENAQQPSSEEQGKGVSLYIMDTGCNVQHNVFQGRAKTIANLVPGESETDLNGHGTHTAGSAGGAAVGIASQADIRCVKILGANGSGNSRSILAGFQAVMRDVQNTGRVGRCSVNMSLTSGSSAAINQMANAVAQSCALCVAAGNEGKDASQFSPASAQGAICVGAVNSTDQRLPIASFSNKGQKVSIMAPGVNVISADFKNPGGVKAISGTSMASPQVAGLCAGVIASLSEPCKDCSQVCLQKLQTDAAGEGRVANVPPGTTNLRVDTSSQIPIAVPSGGRR
ncbi:putative subtilisin-like protease [Ophiocordyceps polyrhachis-furcata BCC 54312]|uniref:Subtilisin-like protease n=1 Tax=Ophiocordyceps polyrhachis-furcata BCC 54312 TaxID=1330021 RepID=A0A367L0J0_9HYPO|nr:putative subtilisin-like protease [Ophiocordyceps polyrhachis-furcata BCC 54312]